MGKILYYVVEKQTDNIGDVEECTGNKNVVVYDIVNNIPETVISFECSNSDNTENEIVDNLDEDEFDLDNLNLIQL